VKATRFVESYIDAWNHRDPKGVADHLAAGGIYRDVPQKLESSHDELIKSLRDFFVYDEHKYELVGDILTGRESIAFQYRVSRSDESRDSAHTGAYRGAEFMNLSGDAAMSITDYYDIPGMMQAKSIVSIATDRSLANKYAKSGLNTDQLEEFKRRLNTIMRSKQAFLQSDLTLPKLAAAVECSVNHLSQVINAGFGMSFFDYLNKHRIEYAKKQLREYDSPNSAILNVAFAAGFNSNSAFYAAFKKCLGQTPAQYRRAQSRNNH
jgi:AraC-like DNA-binding protein